MKEFYKNHSKLFWFIVVAVTVLTILTVRDCSMTEDVSSVLIETIE